MRKHRIIERLLTDFMGYTAAEAHVHADELGDTFTDDMIERIDEQLGHPERCPHGWPVDTVFEQAENPELTPLSAIEPGSGATIVRLAEHDGDLLHWFYDEGFVPGASVEVAGGRAGRRPVPRAARRRREVDQREGRGRPLRAADGVRARAPLEAVDAVAAASRPAAARSAAALSVRSQVKSASSRPKWPYAAVFA